jgi:hypothetical protein
LVELLPLRTRAMYDLLAGGHATGTQPWAKLWREGHGPPWSADTDYIAANTGRWQAALVG